MNKLLFPKNPETLEDYNLINPWSQEDDLNCTMNLIFYDSTNGVADINRLNPIKFKAYFPDTDVDLYAPHIDYISYTDNLFKADFLKNSNLPCNYYNNQGLTWEDISLYEISVSPMESYNIYLLDLEGNILTHAYKNALAEDSYNLLSFNGFKICTELDLNNISKLKFTYEGLPSYNKSFDAFLVMVATSNRGINYNVYRCIKIHFENRIRLTLYAGLNLLLEAFQYSLDIPTIEYLSEMQWNSINSDTIETPTILNIEFDKDGNLKQGSNNQLSICKFVTNILTLLKVSISNNISYAKDIQDDWLTISTEDSIYDLYNFIFSVSANEGGLRQNNIIIRDITDSSFLYLNNILKVVISLDAASELPESYDYYTAIFGRLGNEITLSENTEIQLYVDKTGEYINTLLEWTESNYDEYPIKITKKRYSGGLITILPFTPTIQVIQEGSWISCTRIDQLDIGSLVVTPLSPIPAGGTRNATITILDSSVTILQILVEQSNTDTVARYYLYGKNSTEENWSLIETSSDPASHSTLIFPYNGGTISRFYAVICPNTEEQLNINNINVLIPSGLPTLNIEKTVIEDASTISEITNNALTSGVKLCFRIDYIVTSFNNNFYGPFSKFIYLVYGEGVTHSINIYQEAAGSLHHLYSITEDDSLIWDRFLTTQLYVSCVDTGEGLNVDATSLLYKGTTGNIYKTIEAKDTRLFLGNYKTPKQLNDIEESGARIFDSLLEEEGGGVKRGPHIKSAPSNLLDNSYDMRMFKKDETYLLGVVFVYKTGLVSNVHFLKNPNTTYGEYELDALFYTNTNKKEIFYIDLTINTLNSLKEAGIAAVIPVRAINTSFRTYALGFSLPSIQIDNRLQDTQAILQYPYRYGVKPFIIGLPWSDCQINTNIDYLNNIIAINTPEMDCSEDLTLALFDCKIKAYTLPDSDFVAQSFSRKATSLINVYLLVDSKYVNSYLVLNRDTWFGFIDLNNGSTEALNNIDNYGNFHIYIWNREIVGGEWPAAKIKKKVFVYSGGTSIFNPSFNSSSISATCYTYRNYDYPLLLKLNGFLYQGNIDYTFHTNDPYYITAEKNTWPPEVKIVKASTSSDFTYTKESGIDLDGKCYAPVWMRYKATPHIVADLGDSSLSDYSIVELYDDNIIVKDEAVKVYSQWIKCGPMISTDIPILRPLRFLEGDWFFGKYECLRTYPYSLDDPNSLVEVFSGKLMSKVNLNCRADINVGVVASYLNNTNFNIFNTVYNLEDNYFTYMYRTDNISYDRMFANTILWSLNKLYGSEIDEWCHILDVNSLDLDGDKGEITSIENFNGALITFLSSGISLILFNDNVQVSAKDGTPIEIVNSGIVNGKRYLLDRIGCQNRESIANSPKYIYFIDSINKSIYNISSEGAVTDICYAKGMKSWAILNISKNWWSYYDVYSQEILFADNNTCIAYNDILEYFPCFLSYLGVKHLVSLNGRTYLFDTNNSNTLWKKNSSIENKIFDVKVPIEIEIIANPEPTEDKIFETIEYRADGFSEYNENDLFSTLTKYNHLASFDTILVNNEYQDTDVISLYSSADGNTYTPSEDTYKTVDSITHRTIGQTTVQKKFRIWRILIPRVAKTFTDTSSGYSISSDRIRNPWCKIKLSTTMNNYKKLIVHDFAVRYFK